MTIAAAALKGSVGKKGWRRMADSAVRRRPKLGVFVTVTGGKKTTAEAGDTASR